MSERTGTNPGLPAARPHLGGTRGTRELAGACGGGTEDGASTVAATAVAAGPLLLTHRRTA